MYRTLLLSTLLVAASVSAQIYKTTDEQGNVVFTDTPPADSSSSQQVEVRETNTAPPPAQPAQPAQSTEPAVDQAPAYEIAITEPANESTIPNGPGNFSVRISMTPSLAARQSLQLYMDGEPWGEPRRDSWELVNVFRGAHDLTVGALDAEGNSLATSEPIRVYVHRPSVNFRNRN